VKKCREERAFGEGGERAMKYFVKYISKLLKNGTFKNYSAISIIVH
jgi:hypothetical protein